ncbi:hypothetical protein PhaeoP23_01739 [Phaeobacter piscinae]|uniref:HTH cro/C1-type domain-containing protein n=2 Tax=Roseobacteraceae TaxID=2854170 RepID=A0ABN5DFA9_9RHOB|nr:hypothetical protein PhaeoP36_01739 [Phaeobacter piscinae]ATG39816.1 hypothetical protein PhaeoP14_01716 [Phaeobacter piscinae]AUQ86402.1 hypothetical protein PhaeoP42_01740 [Phaeobacter piscinae]AUR24285.1 hypothetical protein PhaeoP23_01739 [Phaeobacter piscinae]UTS80795.1 hypothetical protein OL67_001865 [Phaeobacter piscinae]
MTLSLIDHWKRLISADGRSQGELAELIGKSPGYFSKVWKGGHEPGVFTTFKLASVLGVSHEHLMGLDGGMSLAPSPGYQSEVNRQASRVLSDVMRVAHQRLSIWDNETQFATGGNVLPLLLRWWHQQSGHLVCHEGLRDHFDIIKAPDVADTTVEPLELGARSLAATKLGTNSADALKRLVEGFDTRSRMDLVRSYYDVSQQGTPALSAPISVRIPLPDGVPAAKVEYFRLQLPVVSPNGERFVLSYCFPA